MLAGRASSCKRGIKKLPFSKFLLDPSKILLQFFACFESFTENKLFAPSILFTTVLMGITEKQIKYTSHAVPD